jgi:hypothetical protein
MVEVNLDESDACSAATILRFGGILALGNTLSAAMLGRLPKAT